MTSTGQGRKRAALAAAVPLGRVYNYYAVKATKLTTLLHLLAPITSQDWLMTPCL